MSFACTTHVGSAIPAILANPHRDGRIRTSDFLLPKQLRPLCRFARTASDSRCEQAKVGGLRGSVLSAYARLCGQRVRRLWDPVVAHLFNGRSN